MNTLHLEMYLICQNQRYEIAAGEFIEKEDYFEYRDNFGCGWRLIPVTNENIKFPFIIEPIGDKK